MEMTDSKTAFMKAKRSYLICNIPTSIAAVIEFVNGIFRLLNFHCNYANYTKPDIGKKSNKSNKII